MVTLLIVGFIIYILGKIFFPGVAGLIGGIATLWIAFVLVCAGILVYYTLINL